MHTETTSAPHAGFNSLNLAAGKNTVRAVATVAVAVPELLSAVSAARATSTPDFVPVASSAAPLADLSQSATVLSMLWPGVGSASAVALVVWAGLGPGALGSVLQTYGQRSVSPPVAQVRPLRTTVSQCESSTLSCVGAPGLAACITAWHEASPHSHHTASSQYGAKARRVWL